MTEREELQTIIAALVGATPPERLFEAIWDVIAPMVRAQALEEAAILCDGERVKAATANAWKMADAIEHCGNLIRALAAKKL